MRILQVAPPWFAVPPTSYGGTELVVAGLADGLVAAGHDVTLLAAGGSRTAARLVSTFPEPPSADLGDVVTELLHVTTVDDLGRFDLVHDHTLLGTARLAARGSVPLVHTLHGPWAPRLRQLCRRLADRVALVAISHHQARAAGDVPLAGVVHNGIDVGAHPPGRGPRDGLLFVGRADVEKGPEQAIEVARRTGQPLTMAIKVNQPDEAAYWEQVLRPLVRALDVEVVLNADHRRKVAMMGSARAVLMPLQWPEPFGLVMVEAGACGAPVVANDRGAAPEIVVDGTTGFLVDPEDGVEGLCAAVDRVDAIDPVACRAHVEQHFSARAMVTGYLNVYEAVLRRRSGPATARDPVAVPHRPIARGPGAGVAPSGRAST